MSRFIDSGEVATLLGVERTTVYVYKYRAEKTRERIAAGEDIEDNEMPAPAGKFGNSPVWDEDAMKEWDKIRRGRTWRKDQRDLLVEDLVTRYQTGESVRSLAASTGRSYGFIRKILTDAGIEIRKSGWRRR